MNEVAVATPVVSARPMNRTRALIYELLKENPNLRPVEIQRIMAERNQISVESGKASKFRKDYFASIGQAVPNLSTGGTGLPAVEKPLTKIPTTNEATSELPSTYETPTTIGQHNPASGKRNKTKGNLVNEYLSLDENMRPQELIAKLAGHGVKLWTSEASYYRNRYFKSMGKIAPKLQGGSNKGKRGGSYKKKSTPIITSIDSRPVLSTVAAIRKLMEGCDAVGGRKNAAEILSLIY